MLRKFVLVLWFFCLPWPGYALDVSFGNGAFFDPPQFLEMLRGNSSRDAVERADRKSVV